ncbi:hypothetical protein Bca52824_011349 [Brassica carinata]|uniref:Uncharacterized protein n=1 Tax=Brassica carinata TaxID=52824 RepID=A0A8X7WEI3_BRACI|nr:hypothetical protein Bca52824_011349 [Brassica carinata]
MTVDNVIGTDTNLQATDVAAMMEMMKNIMDRMTRQHEPNKLTNECLPEITTVITPPAAYDDNPATTNEIDGSTAQAFSIPYGMISQGTAPQTFYSPLGTIFKGPNPKAFDGTKFRSYDKAKRHDTKECM